MVRSWAEGVKGGRAEEQGRKGRGGGSGAASWGALNWGASGNFGPVEDLSLVEGCWREKRTVLYSSAGCTC